MAFLATRVLMPLHVTKHGGEDDQIHWNLPKRIYLAAKKTSLKVYFCRSRTLGNLVSYSKVGA